MLLGLPERLPGLVEAKFRAAQATKSLIFSSTELAIIRTTAGVPFQLRYCPALAKKPTKVNASEKSSKKFDPFDNPPSDLLIADIPTSNPTHLLVLNKFPVIADHLIIATKVNKQQTWLLEEDDLDATYSCLKAWEEEVEEGRQNRLFAFFNSGDHSGASQPHRHLQCLPVERMHQEKDRGAWEILIDSIEKESTRSDYDGSDCLFHPSIPFAHFGLKLPENPTASELHKIYMRLYNAAAASVRKYIDEHPNTLELHSTEGGSSPISYNLAMTTSAMVVCPRKREGDVIRRDDGSEAGFVALNGTVLGGTLMVKLEEEWDLLRKYPAKLDELLLAIGIPLAN